MPYVDLGAARSPAAVCDTMRSLRRAVRRSVSAVALIWGLGCIGQEDRDATRDRRVDTGGNPAVGVRSTPPGVASPSTDTVPLRRVFWDVAGVQTALMRAGLGSRVVAEEVSYPGLGTGTAIEIESAEVQVFLFGDIAAADRALQAFNMQRARPAMAPRTAGAPPHGFINNNMLVLLFARSAAIGERLDAALAPEPERLAPDDAEP